MLRRENGGLDFVRPLLDRVAEVEKPWRPGLVALLTELGLAERARPHLREAIERDLPSLRPSASWPASLSFLGEAAARLRERDALEALLPDAEVFAGLNLLGSEMLATLGSGDRLLAVMKSALSLPGVDDHFAAALEMDSQMGFSLHVATTQAEWAAHLRRAHAPASEVESHAAAARVLADRHGLVRVQRILGPMAGLGRSRLPDGLTSRELDVLRLIGEGRSNRDIAAILFISENTAANHVRSILMKTQSGNRTAAAHYAMRHGLLVEGRGDGRRDAGVTSDHRVQ
jgi:DNA-binding CsgD family transcriptional regulator